MWYWLSEEMQRYFVWCSVLLKPIEVNNQMRTLMNEIKTLKDRLKDLTVLGSLIRCMYKWINVFSCLSPIPYKPQPELDESAEGKTWKSVCSCPDFSGTFVLHLVFSVVHYSLFENLKFNPCGSLNLIWNQKSSFKTNICTCTSQRSVQIH